MPTPPALRSFVVLGADAGDGQTLVASALVQALCGQGVKAVAMKAAPHGDELQRLAAASAFGLPPRVLCPPPGAPTLDAVVDTFRVLATWADAVVLDGADPAGPEGADVARALGLPFVFVVGLRPGCAVAAVHKAQALARSLADGPYFAHTVTKTMLNQEWAMGIEEIIESEAQAQALCMLTQDFKRAFDAFAAKQQPKFEGN